MLCRHILSDDCRWVLLYMSTALDIEKIAYYTGIPHRMIEQVLMEYRHHGTANRLHVPNEVQGGAQMLMMDNAQVCTNACSCVMLL